MNRKNLSVAVVLAVLLTLAVGYALFSQTINITGTATAQGSFSYNIEVQKDINNEINSNNIYEIYNYFGNPGSYLLSYNIVSTPGLTSLISSSGNNVTYSAAFTKPNQKQFFTIKITNTGTIPMSVDYYTPISSATYTLTGTITGKSGTVYQASQIRECIHGGCADNLTSDDNFFATHGITNEIFYVFVPQTIYTDLEDEDDYVPAILETNESIYLVVKCSVNDISANSKIKAFNLTSTYSVSFNINQATN